MAHGARCRPRPLASPSLPHVLWGTTPVSPPCPSASPVAQGSCCSMSGRTPQGGPATPSPMNNQPGAAPFDSTECAPFTDLMDTGDNQRRPVQKQKSGKGWYAQMSDGKKAEYLERRHLACQQNKVAALTTINSVQASQSSSTLFPSLHRTPLSNITITNTNGNIKLL